MKEATGELSMTAIVVVIIGIIAVAAPPIVRSVINSMSRSANCKAAFNCETTCTNNMCTCWYLEEGASSATAEAKQIQCPKSEIGR